MVKLKLQFPPHFFEGETRCDYYISPEMKKVWAVELDLLAEVQRVCQKHDIQYFADGGTLLGTVRHHGMIPWDDDIDLGMLRPEYERFCQIAPSEFQSPYFFQTEETDPGSLRGHIQIRNSETTGILFGELPQRKPFNQGIFIDIFPFDQVPDDLAEQEQFLHNVARKKTLYWSLDTILNYYTPAKHAWKRPIKYLLSRLLPKSSIGIAYRAFQREVRKYEQTDCHYIGDIIMDHTPKKMYPKEWLSRMIEMDFEFLRLPVPIGNAEMLATHYGDWQTFVKGTSDHGGVKFDTDCSYKQYLEKHTREIA